ncbi:hypothetical protein K504DRAFT_494945 [Pleomassaria siparia CBS 279.74]|uniref:BTB domain-containing protein n=1 Tax=Pleomassaria siparia CBS 279.74 TaxID=1314801 RepID=A0A6G1JV83_9PLEO|nr:hypothetical protein K504DRAFT_494945 [Pleomassaria siparia CBS 279.74]
MATSSEVRIIKKTPYTVDISGQIIKVCVGDGDQKKTFLVHESVICPRSEFFRRAMQGSWKEAEDHTINLMDEKPDIFQLYTQLLYTNSIPIELNSGRPGKKVHVCPPLSQLYVLADKLMDNTAKDHVLETLLLELRKTKKTHPGVSVINIIYENTPGPCPARRIMADLWVDRVQGSIWITKHKSQTFHPDFILDIALGMLDRRFVPKEKLTETCHAQEYRETGPGTGTDTK